MNIFLLNNITNILLQINLFLQFLCFGYFKNNVDKYMIYYANFSINFVLNLYLKFHRYPFTYFNILGLIIVVTN